MACFGNESAEGITVVGECPNCGSGIDSEGFTLDSCDYSPTECEVCGFSPCDGSC